MAQTMTSDTIPVAPAIGAGWVRRFATIWTGQTLSLLGTSVVQFALIWWLTQTTQSATVLAFASLVGFLPQIILGPVAGTLVDRYNRRRIMILADVSAALASLALAFLFAIGQVQLWHVFTIMFWRSLMQGLQQPAMSASVSMLVPPQHLARIGGMNSAAQGLSGIISPIIGAFLISRFLIEHIVLLDVISAILAVLPLLFIAIPQPARDAMAAGFAGAWDDLRVGLRYVRGWPGLLLLMLLACAVNALLVPASSLLALLITERFNGTPDQLALTQAALGLGMLGGGLALGMWGGSKRRIYTVLLGLMGIGLGFLMVGLAPVALFPVVVAGIFITGLTVALCNGPLAAIMQAVVEPEMQGRVFGLLGSAALAGVPLTLIVTGPIADNFGIPFWYLLAGIITFVIGVGAFFLPPLLRIEDGKPKTGISAEAV